MEMFEKIFVGIILILYFSAFAVKNIVTAKRTRLPIKGKSAKVTLLIISVTALYMITCAEIFLKPGFLLEINVLNLSILRIFGLILVAASFLLGVAALLTMRNSWRVGVRNEQKTELITKGIFKFSRNPYFLSYILMFLGIFFVFPNVIYLVFYLAMVILVHQMIRDEENYLAEQHGNSYLNYRKSVGRYWTIK